jgi:hypothetical protein
MSPWRSPRPARRPSNDLRNREHGHRWRRHRRQRHREPGNPGVRHRDRGGRPHQVVWRQGGGAQSHHEGEARPDLRVPRPQRVRQDHHDPDAVRPAHPRFRPRHLPRLRHPHPVRQDQDPGRLHDPALQPLRGSVGAREPGVHRPHLRHPEPARRRARRHRAPPRAPPSRASASADARSRSRARCRAAGSSASRSAPARSPIPSFCCSTSPPPASTPRRAASSGTRSMRWPPTA